MLQCSFFFSPTFEQSQATEVENQRVLVLESFLIIYHYLERTCSIISLVRSSLLKGNLRMQITYLNSQSKHIY